MTSLTLLRPYWLLALLPAALLWWSLWRGTDPRGAWRQIIAPHLLDHLMVESGPRGRLRPIVVLAAVWALMVLALAGPAWRAVPSPFAEAGAGVVVVLRNTPSMLATDVAPTRLARSLQKLRDFLEAREGAPTGLIVYSGSSHLVMPMTTDSDVLLFMTEGLGPTMMPQEGDVLPQALRQAELMIQGSERPGSILLMADTTTSDAASVELAVPLQVLGIAPAGATDPALQDFAKHHRASVEPLAADSSDVDRLARRSRGALVAAESTEGQRMQDEGFWLLPLIALGMMLWGRKGWVVG
jgi:Ca-activated chloride channel family protein